MAEKSPENKERPNASETSKGAKSVSEATARKLGQAAIKKS